MPVEKKPRPAQTAVAAFLLSGFLSLLCQQLLQGLDLQTQALVFGFQLGHTGLQGFYGWNRCCIGFGAGFGSFRLFFGAGFFLGFAHALGGLFEAIHTFGGDGLLLFHGQ